MIIRIINLLVIAGSLLLTLTGLRIWFFHNDSLPPIYLAWIDSARFGGNVFTQHIYLGYMLIGLIVFKATLEVWRLTKIRHQNDSSHILWQIKSLLKPALYTLVVALTVSGLAVYHADFGNILVLATFRNIHTYSSWGVLIFAALYALAAYLSRRYVRNLEPADAAINSTSWVRLIAAAVAAAGCVWLVFHFIEKPTTLVSKNINRRIALNGIEGLEWTGADSTIINLANGDNFPNGMTKLKIKSFHGQQEIHFLFQWRDWEPSQNRLIEKTVSGWRELKSFKSPFGESVYFEDQLAISFHNNKSGCLESCHLGGKNSVGLHYTKGDTADLWVWQAVNTNPAMVADDGWWGGYQNDSVGGRNFDNSPGGGNASNLNEEWDEPYFLPGPLRFGNWINTQSDQYVPFRAGLDKFKIGATLPARLVSRFSGDRGDLRARARWDNGVWTLEISRKIKTGSSFDMSLRTSCRIGLAIFNNSELGHAYHLKPIELLIE